MEEEKKTEQGGKYAGLSKGQIKKLKEKEKKEREAAAAAATQGAAGADGGANAGDSPAKVEGALEPTDSSSSAPGAKGKKKKGKKGGLSDAMKAKIAAEQEEKRKLEEQQRELERIEEEKFQKQLEEEKKREEELKAAADAKKEAKLAEKERLKKAGLWKTPAQLKKEKQQQAKRAQMVAAGLIPASALDEEADDAGEAQKPQSNIVRNKKKKNKQQDSAAAATNSKPEEEKKAEQEGGASEVDTTASTAATVAQPAQNKAPATSQKQNAAAAAKVESDDEELDDDWENTIEKAVDKLDERAKDNNVPLPEEDNDDDSEDGQQEENKEDEEVKQPSAAGGKKGKKSKQDAGGPVGSNLFDAVGGSRRPAAAGRRGQNQAAKKSKKLRCPIVCIMGHVDTGKTLILDKLRKTNVQANEAGGITQQIGATYFPRENLAHHISIMENREDFNLEIPGFLVIDTPGHESFTNLRSRGSSLCDLAVLVVDIMHGLEQQTLESIQLLKQKNTPFCIALNKIDRLNQWSVQKDANSRDTLDAQNSNAQNHFEAQLAKTVLAFNEQGFNVALYWSNDSPEDTLSFIPTSAITGEGLSDLIFQLCKMGQTTERQSLEEKDIFECTVLEVKVIEGHGTTIDVVLVNGVLKVGDTIVISGLNGPIKTNIRALLTPFPMKEMRVKGEYQHHKKIKGAMGIKISAPGLDHAIAGSELFKCSNEDEVQEAIEQIEGDLVDILEKYVDKTSEGVCVQASTIGSLEALLEFLYVSKIPVSSVNIGPVHKKDVLKAMKSLVKTEVAGKKEYACLLAFDVKVMPEAQQFADENEIKIFTAKIIYHLQDNYIEYKEECERERKAGQGNKAIFPCICEMVPDACFNRTNPIVIGLNVIEGILKPGTPLCVPDRENLRLGTVLSIEANKKPQPFARANTGSVAVKISNDGSVSYGRHFDDQSNIVSLISRDSIDALKLHFKDEMTQDDWRTCIKLKKLFQIQ